MIQIFVKPAEGRKVWNIAARRPLRAEGELVPANQYWVRRIQDGDVVEVVETRAAKKPSVKE